MTIHKKFHELCTSLLSGCAMTFTQQGEIATYRKVDIISKEEFDSQRGETDEATEMVFPLDLPDPGKTEGSGVAVKPPPVTAATTTTSVVPGGEREGEEVECPAPHSKDMAQPRKETKKKSSREKPEKRARFYPLPNKQGSPTKVECWGYSSYWLAVPTATSAHTHGVRHVVECVCCCCGRKRESC